MKKLLAFFKRRGFTLVEALVVTVIAGYCILPVVGTLQSGVEKTQSFNHREKLRLLARSRLNKELSVAAFDHTAIDATTKYHYVYYNTDPEPQLMSIDAAVASDVLIASQTPASVSSILYSYKVSVAVDENLKLGTTSLNLNSDFITGVGGLKAVTVTAELEMNDNVVSTDSISLFSLLNIPSFTDDYLWVSNPKNVEIISIDPISRMKVDSFLLPLDNTAKPRDDGSNDTARPWNIAVHPNKKFIAIQCKHKIKALNIDQTSPKYGAVKEIWPSSIVTLGPSNLGTYASKLADVNKDDKNKAAEDRGIVFRPDGKMCFVAAHDEKSVFSLVASYTDDWNNLHLIASSIKKFDVTSDKSSFLHAGHDGYLYSGPTDVKIAFRFPMYATNPFDNPEKIDDPDSDENVEGCATSPDGKEFYLLWGTSKITRHDSLTGAKIGGTTITPTDASKHLKDITLGYDGRYLAMMDPSDAAGKGGMFMLNLSTHPITSTNYNFTTGVPAILKRATPDAIKKTGVNYVLFSQLSREFIFDDINKPNLFAADIPGLVANSYTSSLAADRVINFATTDKSEVNFAIRPIEYFLVGSVDGAKGYIEYVDLNAMNESDPRKRKPVESMRIDLANNPVCIGLTRTGEKMRVGYGANRAGLDIFETYGSRTRLNALPEGAQWMYGVVAPDEDLTVDPSCTMFVSMDYHASTLWANGYWANLPLPSTIPANYKNPSDIDIPVGWQGQDIETMSNGGILILYRHTTTNDSMLEWIGKHQFGPHIGKYERFARWYSTANNFPPFKSQNIALSPDDRYLAIESASSPNLIYLYDFAANNFGGLTQQEGLLVDYRQENQTPWTFAQVMASCSFSLANPADNTLGIKLRDCTTASDTWPSIKNYPANYFYRGGATLTATTNNAKKGTANKRFLGYYKPDSLINTLAVSQLDYSRVFFGQTPVAENPTTPNATLEFPANMAANTQTPLQLDICRAPTSVRKICCGANIAVPGWEPDPSSSGSVYPSGTTLDTSPVKNTVSEPQELYQSHRWIDGTLSYSFAEVPDGPATVKLHFNDNWATSVDQRKFNIAIEGVTKATDFDIISYALPLFPGEASNTAIVISYDDVIVSSAGGAGLQIDLSKGTANNPLICGIEFVAGGDSYMGLYASATADALGGSVASTSLTPIDKNNMSMTGWNRIASTSTMPFSFQPVFLRMFPLTGNTDNVSTAMTFSRDIANPILYTLIGGSDSLFCLKPGKPMTEIMLGSIDISDKQLLISNDGQKLIYASEDADKEATIVDISDPNSFNFNGIVRTQSALTGYGSVVGVATMTGTPKVLANMPLNAVKSTYNLGSYEFVATLSINVCGLNNAAVASGGIYIMGGATLENAAATSTIFCFNPLASQTGNMMPLTASMPRRLKMHSVVAYDDEVYTFNGYDQLLASITDLVQKYNPTTGKILAYQEAVAGVTTSFRATAKMTSGTAPFPNVVTHTGSINTYYTQAGWKAYDGDTSLGWASTANNNSVTYDFGKPFLAPIVTSLRISNNYSPLSAGVKNFVFYGSNDGVTWTSLTTGTVPYNAVDWTCSFSNNNPYQQYKLTATSNHGSSSYWSIREMRLFNGEVRKVSPSGMNSSSKDGMTVSTSHEGGSEPGWKVFDGNKDSEWDTNTAFTASGEWISMDLGTADNIDVVRILCQYGADDGIKVFKLQGSNIAAPGTTEASTDWTTIPCLSGSTSTPQNPSNGVWNNYYFNNASDYKHYRIFISSTYGSQIEVKEIEFYSTDTATAAPEQNFLTRTITDKLEQVKVKENAACVTPYGIVLAGGRISSTVATTTCLVYWPHGFHSYNSPGDYSLGISRSLPNLNQAVADHTLVWHKGVLYRVGGANAAGTTSLSEYERFDYATNQWVEMTVPTALRRHKAAACSHGDEIYIFGGQANSTQIDTAYAWEPSSNQARVLAPLPKSTGYSMTAVSCGSSIYLIGGSDSSSAGPSASILKFTP